MKNILYLCTVEIFTNTILEIMKIERLQIGDWVYDGDTPAQITGITCDGIIETTVNEKTNIELLEPIHLTKEMLADWGFEKYLDVKDVVYYKSTDGRIEMTNHEDMKNTFNEWSVHVDTEDMRTMGHLEVTYVHELQQFLRLCDIDFNVEF